MYSFILIIVWQILKYSLITAAVLTYIDLAPNGDVVKSIVLSMKDALMQIDWVTLIDSIVESIKSLIASLWDIANDNAPKETKV